jgi:hypothetical protein
MRVRRIIVGAFCAALVSGANVGTALAGEVTGTGAPTNAETHANSICVFSGQNDDPTAPLSLDLNVAPNGPGGVSQSFGQDVKLGLDPHDLNPGDACRGFSNPFRE